MLKLTDITKDYPVGDSTVHALRGVSIEFRKSEFVSILGQSGCGKTTLLNIIGGLDKYTSGDLIINGRSTKEYGDRDWDSYRNHSIGFVFQSYNLIPHQTVLANVELALTLSGVSKEERKKRATEALETVGLGDQLYKKPNQMSGGQMQRVAIARALVNDPDILLADEPTGALDSETSVQIMELLKEISREKLIIMVTHNPEIANTYSTRIINLLDGRVINDTDPYVSEGESVKADNEAKAESSAPVTNKKSKKKRARGEKTSMSFFTALSLSLNNLLTKKGRTFLTSFAGSIGIIGIALILSVSQGVNAYIKSVEESTMSSYPLEINESTMDTMTMLGSLMEQGERENIDKNMVYSNDIMVTMMDTVVKGMTSNNLTAFKEYIESTEDIKKNSTDIKYVYRAGLNTYKIGVGADNVRTYFRNLSGIGELMSEIGLGAMFSGPSNAMMGGGAWMELVGDSDYIESQYELLHGSYPQNKNEVILIVDSKHQVSDFILYTLGIRNIQELKSYISSRQDTDTTNDYTIPEASYSFEEICGYEFKVLPDSEKYKLDGGKIVERTESEINSYLSSDKSITLKVVGIVTPSENSTNSAVIGSIGYRSELMSEIIALSNESEVIDAQEKEKNINLLNGLPFAGFAPDCEYLRQLIRLDPTYEAYEQSMSNIQVIQLFATVLGESLTPILETAPYGGFTTDNALTIKASLMAIDDDSAKPMALALMNTTDENFIKVINSMLEVGTFDTVMSQLGQVRLEKPSTILIYPKDFEAKDIIKESISVYNDGQSDSNRITYTDTVALLMNSVTTIINAISYVLIAFVAISLVVSSIMIGIITYISVLERTKEIGILRAIGASKKDVSRVFNAETLIVGFAAGLIGILASLVLIIFINIILQALTGLSTLKAVLPLGAALILIGISMGLTLIAGLFPSSVAAKKDPVIALRSE